MSDIVYKHYNQMSIRHERFFCEDEPHTMLCTLNERTNDFSMNYEIVW